MGKMKLACSQQKLALALSIVGRAVSPNNTLPVLNNILLKAEAGRLFLSATNLEIAIKASLEAKVDAEGALTVPAKVLSAYVPLLKDQDVKLNLSNETTLEVSAPGSRSKMKGISSEEFPNLPGVEELARFVVPADKLRSAIEKVVFAASANISRPVLTGVLWAFSGKGLKLAATDSYRLAEVSMDVDVAFESEMSLIVPARTTAELSKILSSMEASEVEVVAAKNQVLFRMGGVELMSRLVEGNFPDYEKILPTSVQTTAKLRVDDFVLALKRVLVIVKENNNSMRFKASDGKLEIESEETQVGEALAEVFGEVTGGECEVALNAQYLLDVLGHLNDEMVNFGLNDGLSPVMVTPASTSGYKHIVMPLKI